MHTMNPVEGVEKRHEFDSMVQSVFIGDHHYEL